MVPQSDHFLSLLLGVTSKCKILILKLVVGSFSVRLSLLHVNRASAIVLAILLLLTLTTKHTMANMKGRMLNKVPLSRKSRCVSKIQNL